MDVNQECSQTKQSMLQTYMKEVDTHHRKLVMQQRAGECRCFLKSHQCHQAFLQWRKQDFMSHVEQPVFPSLVILLPFPKKTVQWKNKYKSFGACISIGDYQLLQFPLLHTSNSLTSRRTRTPRLEKNIYKNWKQIFS